MCSDNIDNFLTRMGWDEHFERHCVPFRSRGFIPARIGREDRSLYLVITQSGQVSAEVSGRFRNDALSRADFPAVGDWVAVKKSQGDGRAIIHAVLPRKTCFSRKAVLSGGMPDMGGKADEQVLAANVDTVFLVSGLDGDFNLRRIERYVAVAYNSGAAPVIVLNKADLCPDLEERMAETELIAVGVPILPVSAATGDGLEALNDHVTAGRTVAFLGSSGVGKSTIINALLGEQRLKTKEVREHDNRGRHTTSHRELIVLPDGGVVIDTPGMREIQLWGDEADLARAFDDIESLASQCRFGDCGLVSEPGCAVQGALESGELDPGRFDNYIKLQKEVRHLARRKNKQVSRREERARDKKYRQYFKELKKVNKKFQQR